jgi:hypothetical protein
MAGELLKPGVSVVQVQKTTSASFTRPTLVPCVVGPAFEVIKVLSSDGTLNSKAKYGQYKQVGKTITQSAFPNPRGNIDELDIQENTVRPFMYSSGLLNELLMSPGESFPHWPAMEPPLPLLDPPSFSWWHWISYSTVKILVIFQWITQLGTILTKDIYYYLLQVQEILLLLKLRLK